jgi:hypothetical protein
MLETYLNTGSRLPSEDLPGFRIRASAALRVFPGPTEVSNFPTLVPLLFFV